MRGTWIGVGTVLLGLTACGNRSLTSSDASLPDRGLRSSEARPSPAIDGGFSPDRSCELPPGYCRYDGLVDECPSGTSCEGCYACEGKAYWSCGCQTIVPCSVCSACIGKCLPTKPPTPKICSSNKDCAPSDFCQVDGHCVVTGAIAGTCQPRPALSSCPVYDDICPEVCGCDGKTYCDSCYAHSAGVSVATKDACFAATCQGLAAAYAGAIQKAKQCCWACASAQCGTKVPAQIVCGCDTSVELVLPELQAIRDEWTARGCGLGITCPAVKCAPPQPGNCSQTATGGSCADWGDD